MKKNADICLDQVLKHEGGYAERKEEKGGAVNRGITFETFVAWRKKTESERAAALLTFADLKAMTDAEAREIYRDMYLRPIMFDELPSGVDYAVFDAAVNGGVGGSTRVLQRALGHAPDGKFTRRTLWGAKNRHPVDLINKICDERLAAYRKTSIFNKPFKEGATKTWGEIWASRIETVRKRSVKMYENEIIK